MFQWVLDFVRWYNEQHRHSGLKFVTPAQRHAGKAEVIMENRRVVYAAARAKHPNRWSGEYRDWTMPTEVWLNPERKKRDDTQQAA